MGFLHKLWDETVAGPAPENGLRKLRTHISGGSVTSNGHQIKLRVDPGRVPDSPVGSSIPESPLTPGTPNETHATSLNACDWVVLNALDR
ncbi:dormancy-associated protein homolog 4-like [Raphanus sativus]|uniref:Dormancy-associated protein homolog 4-like n=1 Tax=Raphanus sativus TaxID=3726 RepID=A0A9W3DTZ3_RAPSA|nr:dormancy-associated protein homolog 4-like [Raphanus sativus]